jgi:hypothetical protein
MMPTVDPHITGGDVGIGVVTAVLVVCAACQVAWRWLHSRQTPPE